MRIIQKIIDVAIVALVIVSVVSFVTHNVPDAIYFMVAAVFIDSSGRSKQ